MALENAVKTIPNVLGANQGYLDEGIEGVDAIQVKARYDDERAKRLRDEGNKQFIEPSDTNAFQRFQDDPWVDPASIKDARDQFPDNRCRFLIFGAGFGGILYAVRLIEAGFNPDDIRIVDIAGGFGGTWYWNRFPGLMCDIESYSYLPLLEETGYMPKHRYSYGDEIREYAELVARKWKIFDSAVFQTRGQKLEWDEGGKEWKVELLQRRRNAEPQVLHVRSQFVALIHGQLNWPKLPDLPGILDFKGDMFHTSRWRYDITGGSQQDPQLTKLRGKRVAIIGTGATSIQLVPELAQWAKHLYVVQRTPSAVDTRGQRKTDPKWFNDEVAKETGWQRERIKNFHDQFTLGEKPKDNLVDDQWTYADGLVAIVGNPQGPKAMEEIPPYIDKLYTIDLPRQNRIRHRVKQTVKDPQVAEALLPWYPSWCKRPCFHDDYLDTFNRDNVTLLDTKGEGLREISHDSITLAGVSYPVDLIVWATGYRAPFIGSPAEKVNMKVFGRGGVVMDEEWARDGPSTLHGVLDRSFPNLLLSGLWQVGFGGNVTFSTDVLAKHAAYIVAEAERRVAGTGGSRGAYAVSATEEGTQAWGVQMLMNAAPMAAAAGCTPSYGNAEGDLDRIPPDQQMKLARSGLWGSGIESFIDTIEEWRSAGDMKGIEVRA